MARDLPYITNEAESWGRIKQLRSEFSPKMLDSVEITSKSEAVKRAGCIIRETLESAKDYGINFREVCPGHGKGHLVRSYVNAQILFNHLDADPRHIFTGFVAASLHDIGCTFFPRFGEERRAVRHAEVSALFLQSLFKDNPKIKLNSAEQIAITYAIAAHTNCREPEKVQCLDGIERTIEPYQDLDESGKPIYGVWFPRWIDRLDANGPVFLGRLYLTLTKEHKNYDGEKHFDINFEDRMKPLNRALNKQKNPPQTMSETMQMFINSQSNNSPHGKHDFGKMVELRDSYKSRLQRIIDSTQNPQQILKKRQKEICKLWELFLTNNIEPAETAKTAGQILNQMFDKLPYEERLAWCNGFQTAMQEYKFLAEETLAQLEKVAGATTEVYALPMISNDVREIIQPCNKWAKLV